MRDLLLKRPRMNSHHELAFPFAGTARSFTVALILTLITCLGTLLASDSAAPKLGANFDVSSLGLDMVWIEPGTFVMGSSRIESGHAYDEQQHSVTLTQGFWIAAHEVTVGQWKTFASDSEHTTEAERAGGLYGFKDGLWRFVDGAHWRKPGFEQTDQHPVVGVNWHDAKAFCQWLTLREQNEHRLPTGFEYTLPTEAQWEYTCRAGASGRYIGDSLDIKAEVWYKYGAGGGIPNTPKNTHPVGQKRVNAWGLYDVHGNVWEWCEDWYAEGSSKDATDPTGPPTGELRICRGGAWSSGGRGIRSAMRGRDHPNDRATNLGFRVSLRPLTPSQSSPQ